MMSAVTSSTPVDATPANFDVIIVGGGCIGMYLASRLHSSGLHVGIIARSNADAIANEGVTLQGADSSFQSVRIPLVTPRNRVSAAIVVLATKTTESPESILQTLALIEGDPALLVAQNGVCPERRWHESFPSRAVLGCVVFCSIARRGANGILLPASGSVAIGLWPRGHDPLVDKLAKALTHPKTPCYTTRDIRSVRWQKSMWNAAFNLVSCANLQRDTRQLATLPETKNEIEGIMEEVRAVAAAAGHPIPKELIQQFVTGSLALPPGKTSMADDALYRRPPEIEDIAVEIVRQAQQHAVATPRLEAAIARTRTLFAASLND